MQKQKLNAFTLVELIVTIVILAILGTIAFISFQGYSRNSRDSARIADLNSVQKSLGLFVVNTGFYPTPDNSKNITFNGGIAWVEGTIGDTVIKNIDKVSKKGIDPLTSNEYTYSITSSKTEYQIGAISEGGGIAFNSSPINSSYAADLSSAVAYIKGNYNDKFLKVSTGGVNSIVAIPTIIVTDITDTNINNLISGKKLVYNSYSNIPHSYNTPSSSSTGGFDFSPSGNIEVFSGASIDLSEAYSKIVFVTNLQNVYSGTILASDSSYSDIVNLDLVNDQNGAVALVNNYISTDIGGITGKASSVTYKNCTLDGQPVIHGQTISAYSENSILFGASYACTDRVITRTCNDGVLSGDDSYVYSSCVKGDPTNCSASGTYTLGNGHIYNIPSINHASSFSGVSSSPVSISNGTQVYTLTNIECNDGTLINASEDSNTSVTCDSGYIQSGNSCIPDNYTVSGNFGDNASGATINVCGSNITASSTGTFSISKSYGSDCSSISATKTGYSCSTTVQGPASLSSNVSNITGSCTGNTYTITFNANGGTLGTTSVVATYGSAMPSLATAPTYVGYVFNGYYSATSGGTKYYNADKSSANSWNISNNTTLYAQWQRVYNVTLNANGGTLGSTGVMAIYGLDMPTLALEPTNDGYVFNGYYSASSGGTKYYNADKSSAHVWDITSNSYLYAQRTQGYTITSCTSIGQLLTATTTYSGCNTKDIIVCAGNGIGYTISACNIGSSTAGTTSTSYGKYFQWGRNKGFVYGDSSQQTQTIAGTIGLNASTDTYGFVWKSTLTYPYSWSNTDIENNWGAVTNTNLSRKGPCATGYHVPTSNDWAGLVTVGGFTKATMINNLKIPLAGSRDWRTGVFEDGGVYAEYWSSSPNGGGDSNLYALFIDSNGIYPKSFNWTPAYGFPVRCFKN
ncbi:MAG: InlB B-repeat-containing protein [Candidatus Gracilibacteria bacterium]|nr:InlB B-repeat-containing protein [Candidatus Gracilibacteria bacterium]